MQEYLNFLRTVFEQGHERCDQQQGASGRVAQGRDRSARPRESVADGTRSAGEFAGVH